MNIEKKVFNKLFKEEKTELAAEKIELSLINDFEKEFEKALDEETSIGQTLISALGKAENKYKAVVNDYEKAIKTGEKAISSAKDLGIELPTSFNNKINGCKAGISDSRKVINKINQLYSAF